MSLFDKKHLFATHNENNDLQHRIHDIITTIEGISIHSKKQWILFSLVRFLENIYYDTTFQELKVSFF